VCRAPPVTPRASRCTPAGARACVGSPRRPPEGWARRRPVRAIVGRRVVLVLDVRGRARQRSERACQASRGRRDFRHTPQSPSRQAVPRRVALHARSARWSKALVAPSPSSPLRLSRGDPVQGRPAALRSHRTGRRSSWGRHGRSRHEVFRLDRAGSRSGRRRLGACSRKAEAVAHAKGFPPWLEGLRAMGESATDDNAAVVRADPAGTAGSTRGALGVLTRRVVHEDCARAAVAARAFSAVRGRTG
jgi:hypothetical protein